MPISSIAPARRRRAGMRETKLVSRSCRMTTSSGLMLARALEFVRGAVELSVRVVTVDEPSDETTRKQAGSGRETCAPEREMSPLGPERPTLCTNRLQPLLGPMP
jgi:hypothetical protein